MAGAASGHQGHRLYGGESDGTRIVATPAAPTIKEPRRHRAGLGHPGVGEIQVHPAQRPRRHSQHGARLSLHLLLLLPVEVLARLSYPRSEEGRRRDRDAVRSDHDVGFFILADEEPTINRKKFVEFCEELIARGLPGKVLWGINTRVTDILRDEALLPLYRKAGLIHVSLGTEAAAQMKLDRFNKETKVAENKKAIRLLREAGIVVEAQFIVGLENETAETLEETYRMALDWKPDLANWAMYTPWPFTSLFQELGDKVEIFDFEKYNFVTPIIKPEAMDRAELLDRVMNNYRRFYMRKALFSYPWSGTRPAAALPARLPQGVPEIRLRAQVLRPRQGRLLGPAVEEEGRLPFRQDPHPRADPGGRLGSQRRAKPEGQGGEGGHEGGRDGMRWRYGADGGRG